MSKIQSFQPASPLPWRIDKPEVHVHAHKDVKRRPAQAHDGRYEEVCIPQHLRILRCLPKRLIVATHRATYRLYIWIATPPMYQPLHVRVFYDDLGFGRLRNVVKGVL